MSRQRVKTEAPAHKYFTMMLNMAEDDLDPYQYRLLAHYVRWAEKPTFAESLRLTASKVKMSVNTVQKALDELVHLGYLKVKRPTPAEARAGKMTEITIIDRWQENIARYAVSDMTHKPDEPVSDLTQQDAKPVSNMTRLEELNTEELKKTIAPNGASAVSSRIPAAQMNPMKDAIVAAFTWDWETMTGPEKGLVQKTAKALVQAEITPEQISSLYRYCKNKFTDFGPGALANHVSAWKATQPKPRLAVAPVEDEDEGDGVPSPFEHESGAL
jgi:hypothetical protein